MTIVNKKASLAFIFVTLALDSIGLGIVIPVLPDVVRRFVTDGASVSQVFGYFIAVYALLQFVSSPFLGRLSDRFGRRPVLLISLFGAGVDYVFMAFAPTLPLLFVGRLISGISGASYTVANAYIADISDDSNRSKNFGIIGAGFGLGFVLGPAIGGFLANQGVQYPFLAAAIFNFANCLFGLLILPESLPVESRREFDFRALNPFRSLRGLGRVQGMWMLVVTYFLMHLAGQTHPTMWTLYTNHKFNWGPTEIGLSLALVGVLSGISQGALTGPLVKRFGEQRVLLVGTFSEAISYALFGIVTQSWMLYAVLGVSSIFWSSQPALQSLVTKGVPDSEQGEFQGALISLVSIASIVNPLIMTSLFAVTSVRGSANYLPGAPYLLGSLLLFVAWGAAVVWKRQRPKNESQYAKAS